MKNILLFLIVLMTVFSLNAQEVIPRKAIQAYEDLNTGVGDPFWELREGAYVAMFADEEGLKKVFFDREGKWLETRLRIPQAELPAGVRSFIEKHYSGADVSYIGAVTRPQPSEMTYRIESELPSAVVIKLLNTSGRLLEEKTIEWNTFSVRNDTPPLNPLPETGLQPVVRE